MKLIHLIFFIVTMQFLYPAGVRYLEFPELPSLFIEIIIFGVFILSLLHPRNNNIFRNKLFRRYLVFFSVLLGAIMVSAVINSGRWMLVIKSILEYDFIYVFLFIAVVLMDTSESEQISLIKWIYVLILIQIPVMIAQYTVEHTTSADSISGTISMNTAGGTGINAVLSTLLLSFIIAMIISKGLKLKYIVLTLFTFLPPFLGGARFGFILMPITIITAIFAYLFINGMFKSHQIFYILSVSVVIIYGIVITFNDIAPQTKYYKYIGSIEMITDPKIMMEYDKSGSSKNKGRLSIYTQIYEDAFKDSYNVLLGLGTSSMTKSSTLAIQKSKLAGLGNIPDSAKIVLMLGVLGILIICGIFIMTIFSIKKYLDFEKLVFMRIQAYAFIPFTLVLLLSLIYTSIWASPAAMIFWIILGIFIKRNIVLAERERIVYVLKRNSAMN